MKRVFVFFTSLLLAILTACNTIPEENVGTPLPVNSVSTEQPGNSAGTLQVSIDTEEFQVFLDSLETSDPAEVPVECIQTDNTYNEDGSVKIDVYINDTLMDVKVFEDYISKCPGQDNLTSYVLADPVFDLLGIEYSINEPKNEILLTSEAYGEMGFPYRQDAEIIGGRVYIRLTDIETYTDGLIEQADYDLIYLYTGDRIDSGDRLKFFPATLEECYAALDLILSPERIDFFKKAKNGDIIEEHFGLGLWIRNNWIRPDESKLDKLLLEHGINHPDIMSGVIMEGYVKYLNGQPCSLEDLV